MIETSGSVPSHVPEYVPRSICESRPVSLAPDSASYGVQAHTVELRNVSIGLIPKTRSEALNGEFVFCVSLLSIVQCTICTMLCFAVLWCTSPLPLLNPRLNPPLILTNRITATMNPIIIGHWNLSNR